MSQQQIVFPFGFAVLAVILLLCGISETIASIFVLYYSGAYSLGGIYCGLSSMVVAIRCLFVHQRGWYYLDGILVCLSIITAIVAVAVLAYTSSFIDDMKACAVHSGSLSNSCTHGGVSSNYKCYGEGEYYLSAQFCAIDNYVSDGGDDDDCVCIKPDDQDCYVFHHIPSCKRFVDLLPGSLNVSLIFAIISMLLSIVMITMMAISLLCKRTCGLDRLPVSVEENDDPAAAEAMRESLLGIPVTVAYATAPSLPPEN